MFFHMWEHVWWHVLHVTLGEVVVLPNCQSLTPLHWVLAQLCWWDQGAPLGSPPCPCTVLPSPCLPWQGQSRSLCLQGVR